MIVLCEFDHAQQPMWWHGDEHGHWRCPVCGERVTQEMARHIPRSRKKPNLTLTRTGLRASASDEKRAPDA